MSEDKAASAAPRIDRGKPYMAPVSFNLEERRIWFALEANRIALRSRVIEISCEIQESIGVECCKMINRQPVNDGK